MLREDALVLQTKSKNLENIFVETMYLFLFSFVLIYL